MIKQNNNLNTRVSLYTISNSEDVSFIKAAISYTVS